MCYMCFSVVTVTCPWEESKDYEGVLFFHSAVQLPLCPVLACPHRPDLLVKIIAIVMGT